MQRKYMHRQPFWSNIRSYRRWGHLHCHWLVSVSAHRYLECLGTRLELVNDAQPKWANAVCMHEHARFNTSMAIPSEDIRFVLWPIIDRKELECDLSSTTWSCVHIYNAHAAKHSRLIPRAPHTWSWTAIGSWPRLCNTMTYSQGFWPSFPRPLAASGVIHCSWRPLRLPLLLQNLPLPLLILLLVLLDMHM